MPFHSSSTHATFGRAGRLFVSLALGGGLLAGLASASFGAAPAKPTLTVGGPLACRLVNTDQLGYLPGYAPLIRAKSGGLANAPSDFAPALATSWKLSRNNKTLTLTLRHDARFYDGTRVDANAILTWLNYLNQNVYAKGISSIGPVRSITRSGKWTVIITLETPDPFLVKAFSSGEVGTYWAWPASPAAVKAILSNTSGNVLQKGTFGAGPYVLDPSHSVIGDHCTYVPNKYYYDKAKLKWGKVVEKYVVDANAQLAALKTGQLQFISSGAGSVAAAAQAAHFKLITSAGGVFQLFFLDHGAISKPLADVRVRQAINYAIDRTTIVKGLIGPYGTVTDVPNTGSVPGYVPAKYQTYYTYNPSKAKALLASAGYGKGFTLPISCIGDPASIDETAFCSEVAKNLEAVGITVDLKINPTIGGWYVQDFLSKTYPVLAWTASGPLSVPAWYRGFIDLSGPYFHDQHGWRDTGMDKLFYKAIRATPTAAASLFSQMEIRAITQAEFVPVGQTPNFTFASKTGVSDYDRVALDSFSQWYPSVANS
jgi:peptide/nickel transport system substrate-binding protein